jgi:hypothetical protein
MLGREVAWKMAQWKVAMVNRSRRRMKSLGILSLRSNCRKGVGLHLYSTQMRRETSKGVNFVDWRQDFGSFAEISNVRARPRSPCIRSCHAKLGRTSYSYAGGETRRDLASGSREALAEGLSLLSVLADLPV